MRKSQMCVIFSNLNIKFLYIVLTHDIHIDRGCERGTKNHEIARVCGFNNSLVYIFMFS